MGKAINRPALKALTPCPYCGQKPVLKRAYGLCYYICQSKAAKLPHVLETRYCGGKVRAAKQWEEIVAELKSKIHKTVFKRLVGRSPKNNRSDSIKP